MKYIRFASFFKGRLPHKGKHPRNFLDSSRVCLITSFCATPELCPVQAPSVVIEAVMVQKATPQSCGAGTMFAYTIPKWVLCAMSWFVLDLYTRKCYLPLQYICFFILLRWLFLFWNYTYWHYHWCHIFVWWVWVRF